MTFKMVIGNQWKWRSGVNKSALERIGRQNLSQKVPSKKGSLGVIFSPRKYRENAHSKSANFEGRHSGGHLLGRPLLYFRERVTADAKTVPVMVLKWISRRRKRWKTDGEWKKMVDFWCRFFTVYADLFTVYKGHKGRKKKHLVPTPAPTPPPRLLFFLFRSTSPTPLTPLHLPLPRPPNRKHTSKCASYPRCKLPLR